MKNYLLTGTSALALVIAAGAANAQTAPGKFDIKISGDAYFEAGFSDVLSDPAGTRTVDFTNRFRLVINPVATADNGITYGAVARIRANGGAGLIDGDRAYIYVSGNFGTVQGGTVNGPSDATYVAHPADWQIYGLYDQWKAYTAVTTGVAGTGAAAANYPWFGIPGATGVGTVASNGIQLVDSHGIASKLVYYSPRFFGQSPTTGLQAGVSYTPDLASTLTAVNRAPMNFNDVYELTVNYVENFNGVGVKASAGYEGGTALAGFKNLESAQVGLQVSYMGFALGGGYVWASDTGLPTAFANAIGADQAAWNVGGQYTWGPVVVGVKYTEQNFTTNNSLAGNLFGDTSLDAITAGVLYTVAPGLRTGLEYTHFTDDSDFGLTSKNIHFNNDHGDVFLIRTAVTF